MSGGAFSDVVKARVMARSGGFCERCGYPTPHGEYHHRRNRGMGGTSDMRAGQVSNALLLCRSCHLWVTRPQAGSNAGRACGVELLPRPFSGPCVAEEAVGLAHG